MRTKLLAGTGALVLGMSGLAGAALVDVESDNTPGTAQAIVRTPGSFFSDTGVLSLAAPGGDIDFFSIPLQAGEFITINTAPVEVPFAVPDTILVLVGPPGPIVLDADDDSGQGLGSSLTWEVTATGTYLFAISGLGDFSTVSPFSPIADHDGLLSGGLPHNDVGDYFLTVSVVPEPTTLAAVAGAGLLAMRRRRA